MTTQEIASTIYIKLLDCIERTKAGDWEDVVSQCEEIAQLASHANDQKATTDDSEASSRTNSQGQ